MLCRRTKKCAVTPRATRGTLPARISIRVCETANAQESTEAGEPTVAPPVLNGHLELALEPWTCWISSPDAHSREGVVFRALDPRLFIDARRALSGSNTWLFTRGSRVFDITQRTTSRGLRLRDQTMLLGGYTYLQGRSLALEAARHMRNRQRTPIWVRLGCPVAVPHVTGSFQSQKSPLEVGIFPLQHRLVSQTQPSRSRALGYVKNAAPAREQPSIRPG